MDKAIKIYYVALKKGKLEIEGNIATQKYDFSDIEMGEVKVKYRRKYATLNYGNTSQDIDINLLEQMVNDDDYKYIRNTFISHNKQKLYERMVKSLEKMPVDIEEDINKLKQKILEKEEQKISIEKLTNKIVGTNEEERNRRF